MNVRMQAAKIDKLVQRLFEHRVSYEQMMEANTELAGDKDAARREAEKLRADYAFVSNRYVELQIHLRNLEESHQGLRSGNHA